VAIDDQVDGTAEQGLGNRAEILRSLRRKQRIVYQRAVAEVYDAGIADGCATVNVDNSIDTVSHLFDPKVLGVKGLLVGLHSFHPPRRNGSCTVFAESTMA
jgi:hypothetical protein